MSQVAPGSRRRRSFHNWGHRGRARTFVTRGLGHHDDYEKPPSRTKEDNDWLAQQIASNDLIMDNIFLHMPVCDLLSASLVCTSWFYNARRIMRKHKITLVHLSHVDDFYNMSQLFKALEEIHDLDIPFNGIHIKCDLWFPGFPYSHGEVNWKTFLDLISVKIPKLRHFEVDFGLRPSPETVEGIEYILRGLSANLESLTIRANEDIDVLKGRSPISLPKLSSLEFKGWSHPKGLKEKIVAAAPNLVKSTQSS